MQPIPEISEKNVNLPAAGQRGPRYRARIVGQRFFGRPLVVAPGRPDRRAGTAYRVRHM